MYWRGILIVLLSIFVLMGIGVSFQMGHQAGYAEGQANYESDKLERLENASYGDFSNLIFPVEAKFLPQAPYIVVKNDSSFNKINGLGRASAASMVTLSSEVQGKIVANGILKKGSNFKKGDRIVSINNTDAMLGLKARKSGYLTLITNLLPDIKIDHNSNFQAWEQFYLDIDISKPLPQLPETKSMKEKNFIVSRNVITEYIAILADEERLKKYQIYAPFEGSVLETFTDQGAVLNPGSPILTLLRKGNLEIEVPIAKENAERVTLDALVKLEADNKVWTGKVIRKGNYVNPQTQTIPIFIEIENGEDVVSGMFLEAEIATEGFMSVEELPRRAIVNGNKVYKVVGDSIVLKDLNILSYSSDSFITNSLSDGEKIVVEPMLNARENMKVESKLVQ